MKLHIDNQGFEGSVPTNRIPFKISANAKLFGILSDGIYKDKISAVIRELSCNAYDAHVDAKQAKPFRVQVPTQIEPTFSVEDEGTGIDPAKIADIFWTYGESTKTNNNDTIGALGLGSKSPFAYTKSSFTVKNRFAGNEHTYFCFINENGTPDGSEVMVEPTDKPAGVTVELAVRTEDINAFKARIKRFFKNWPTRPEFVGSTLDVPTPAQLFSGTDWYYEKVAAYGTDGEEKCIALMGNVPYPIDLSSIPNPSKWLKFVTQNSFRIKFPLGSLSFQASREELSYEEPTILALEAAAKKLVDELRATLKASIIAAANNTSYGLWASYRERLIATRFNNVDLIGSLFAKTEVFTVNGNSFTAEQLDATEIILKHPGLSDLAILEPLRYSSNSSFASLKNKRTVLMSKAVDPQGLPLPKAITKNTTWFSSTLQPRVTVFGNQPADLLFHGYTPTETYMSVVFSGTTLDFLINDVGTRGRDAARLLGKKRAFYYVDTPKTIQSAAAVAEITAMLKGTLGEGMTIGLLSKQPDFVLPTTSREAPVTKPRGHMEVRVFDPMGRSPSEYVNIDPAGYTAYYITTSREDAALVKDTVKPLLETLGRYNLVDTKGVNFICRNAEDIALFIKKGANLTHIKDMWPQAAKDAVQEAVNKLATTESEQLEYRTRNFLHEFTNNKKLRNALDQASNLVRLYNIYTAQNSIKTNKRVTDLAGLAKYLDIKATMALTVNTAKKMTELYPMLNLITVSSFDIDKTHIAALSQYVAYIDSTSVGLAMKAELDITNP